VKILLVIVEVLKTTILRDLKFYEFNKGADAFLETGVLFCLLDVS